jgi:hypothetical protein
MVTENGELEAAIGDVFVELDRDPRRARQMRYRSTWRLPSGPEIPVGAGGSGIARKPGAAETRSSKQRSHSGPVPLSHVSAGTRSQSTQ